MAMVAPTAGVFQGSDAWIREQLSRQDAKRRDRSLREAAVTVPFDREAFRQNVQVKRPLSPRCHGGLT